MRQKIILVVVIVLGLYVFIERNDWFFQSSVHKESEASVEQVSSAFSNKLSNVQVEGSGEVIAVLKDDTKGSRHQKFIVDLSSGITVLIAHNIDLAPRIDTLRKGDMITFSGEYEWNEKGGVIHWTHHDPQNRHVSGWLKHKGRVYR